MEEKGTGTEPEVAHIIHKILLGMSHFHSVGIIHRDMKPENIMVDQEGEPKIIDFGLSTGTNQNIKMMRVGSLMFMAPEIISGYAHTTACDMWSLGIIVFMMLSGTKPFGYMDLEKEIVENPILFLGDQWTDISDMAKAFVLSLLNKDPGARLNA